MKENTQTENPTIENQTILGLQLKNVMRISAIRLLPSEKTGSFVIGGENAQGKSSVINAIEWALTGMPNSRSEKAVSSPIRKGESKAEIILELPDLTIRRVITEKGSQLVVRGKDGEQIKSPQKLLDSLLMQIAIDPELIMRLSDADRVKLLAKTAGVDVEAHELFLSEKNKELFAVQRDYSVETIDKALTIGRADTTSDEAELAELITEATAAKQKLEDVSELVNSRSEWESIKAEHEKDIAFLQDQTAVIKSQIDELKEKLRLTLADLDSTSSYLNDHIKVEPEKVDTAEILQTLETAKSSVLEKKQTIENMLTHNKIIDAAEVIDVIKEEIALSKGVFNDAISSIELVDKVITVDGGTILQDGVPYVQLSSSEKIQFGMALAIKQNPAIRVIIIRNGSLLDSKARELVNKIAIENKMQVIMEVVGQDEDATIIIEDGKVKGQTIDLDVAEETKEESAPVVDGMENW